MAASVLIACAGAPSAPPETASSPQRDPAIGDLERLMLRGAESDKAGGLQRCLAVVERHGLCAPRKSADRTTIPVAVALDPRYLRWPDAWDRLARTLHCVNRFYRDTGVEWDFTSITPWDPGALRHDLYGLLHRLQHEFPPSARHLSLGITVWEERRIYAKAGGEIGLSQGGACVVPSWPRVENDCVILAHELGHLVGAKHVPGKHWIMGWSASPFHLPAKDPLTRVASVYRFHPRNMAVIATYRSARLTAHGLALPEACRQRIAQIDRCHGL
jgi:hypothetical protein